MTHTPHQPLAPNPSLLAILLVTKSRSGPRLVLHYPPHPTARPSRSRSPVATRQSSRAYDAYTAVTPSTDSDPDAEIDDPAWWSDGSGVTGGDSDEDEDETGSLEGMSGDEDSAADSGEEESNKDDKDEREGQLGVDAVLGRYTADGLAKLLAPNCRVWHRTRWEVALEERCFLGCPIFAREEGGWRREKKAKKSKHEPIAKASVPEVGVGSDEDISDNEADARDTDVGANRIAVTNAPPIQVSTSFTSASSTSGGSPEDAEDDMYAADYDMQMFNVVFVLRPPPLEYTLRVVEMYEHVVRKLAKALRWQQKENGYVAREVKKVTGIVEGFRDDRNGGTNAYHNTTLWNRLHASSSLARALAATYDAIAASKIAHVTLGADGLNISLQIPRQTSTPLASTPMNPQIPGLWLTTSVTMTRVGGAPEGPENDNEEAEQHTQGGIVSPFAAILLLVPAETLLKELTIPTNTTTTTINPSTTHDPPIPINPSASRSLAGPLAYFIRHVVPTKTLLQLSRSTCRALSLADLQLLATHLVSWRRARPLAPPLNASHIYSASPNADYRRLRAAEADFARAFPMLPGLVAMLSKLGRGPPAPYVALVPSSDHKAVYVDALAWLVRGGWVVQLRTFAWVRVGEAVKRRVRDDDRRAAALAAAAVVDEDDAATIASLDFASDTPARRVSATSDASVVSPRARAAGFAAQAKGAGSDAGSAGSARTAIAISTLSLDGPAPLGVGGSGTSPRRESAGASASGMLRPLQTLSHRRSASLGGSSGAGTTRLRPKPSSDLRSMFDPIAPWNDARRSVSSSPVQSADDVDDVEDDPAAFEPSVILSPHKASAVESRWLASIAAGLRDKDVRDAWPRLVKYFDGRHALEEITAREGLKRKVLAPILTRLMSEEEGCLMTVRHW